MIRSFIKMKINEYYRDTAHLSLNGSLAALVPTILIIGGNLSFFQNEGIMLFTIPFLVYSLISFQVYIFKMKRSIMIEKNIPRVESHYHSLFEAKHLLVMFLNTQPTTRLLLYFPDGQLAGVIKKYRGKGIRLFYLSKTYSFYDHNDQIIGFFKVKGKKTIKIEVYDWKSVYVGCYEKKKTSWMKGKKELMDATGRCIGAVEGSSFYMDEQIVDKNKAQVGRLRRGWMPLTWSDLFPEPNTPVLSFWEGLSETDKLLRMSLLINEYFIER